MDRRSFLGAAVATLLSGCGGGGSGTQTPLGSAPDTQQPGDQVPGGSSPPVSSPSQTDWQTLASNLDGTFVLPDTSAYDQARVAFNSRFDSIMPQAVARCATPEDVSQVLAFVRRFNLAVTPRSGGHSYAGYSTSSGIVIDVGPMNAIELNGDIATIGAGAKLAEVYDYLGTRGVSIPTGSCLSVGIAGITQGGGISVVDRTYGLTCDRLVSARIVTADGQHIECDANNHADLFWALRGGGGGNFGVVTSLSFQTFATSTLTQFKAAFRFEEAAAVMAAWFAWADEVPDRIWSTTVLSINTEQANAVTLSISGMCIGEEADLEPYWSSFLEATGHQPLDTRITTKPYHAMMMDYCYGLTLSECHLPGQTSDAKLTRNAMAGSSDIFDTAIAADGIEAMLQAVQQRLASGRTGVVKIDFLGGEIGRVASDATAFVHRNARFDAQYYAYFPADTPAATVDEAGNWATGMRTVMQGWSTGRAYQNYIDPRISNWQAAYYGSNYPRLVRVKGQYDPNWVFRFTQGIPPS